MKPILLALIPSLAVLAPGSSARGQGVPQYEAAWGESGLEEGIFEIPRAIATDGSGHVYVGDVSRVHKFYSNGILIRSWGGFGPREGRFGYVGDIGVSSDGRVYVTDTIYNRVQVFDPGGTYQTEWGRFGSGDGEFNRPSGVAVDSDGTVYVADEFNHRIQRFTSRGRFLGEWVDQRRVRFRNPIGIEVDASDHVYVVNRSSVLKLNSEGDLLQSWSTGGDADGQLRSPYDVAVDDLGVVYVAEGISRVQAFDQEGNFLFNWGRQGEAPGEFYGAGGIATEPGGRIFVSDGIRVQTFVSNPVPVEAVSWGVLKQRFR